MEAWEYQSDVTQKYRKVSIQKPDDRPVRCLRFWLATPGCFPLDGEGEVGVEGACPRNLSMRLYAKDLESGKRSRSR